MRRAEFCPEFAKHRQADKIDFVDISRGFWGEYCHGQADTGGQKEAGRGQKAVNADRARFPSPVRAEGLGEGVRCRGN